MSSCVIWFNRTVSYPLFLHGDDLWASNICHMLRRRKCEPKIDKKIWHKLSQFISQIVQRFPAISKKKSNMQVLLMEMFRLSEATTIESRITIQAMYVKSSVCASKMCCNIFSKTSGRMALFFYWKLATSFKKTKPTETAGIPWHFFT